MSMPWDVQELQEEIQNSKDDLSEPRFMGFA